MACIINTQENVARSRLPTLTSLDTSSLHAILSQLDNNSLKKLRLTNRILKDAVDERVTFLRYGSGDQRFCRPKDIANAYRLWPSVKQIDFHTCQCQINLSGVENYRRTRAAEALAKAPWTDIEILDCKNCGVHVHGGRALITCALRWTGLRKLSLGYCSIDSEGLARMAGAHFPYLTSLDLSHNDLGPSAGVPLEQLALQCPNLGELDLSCNKLEMEGLKHILKVELKNLQMVQLQQLKLNAESGILLGSAKWPRLRKLDVSLNELGDHGIVGVCRGEWPELQELNLSGITFGIEGAEALRAAAGGYSPKWPCLKRLDRSESKNCDRTLNVLCRGHWEGLEYLSLELSNLGIDGSRCLAAAAGAGRLPSLATLELQKTCIDADAINALLSVCWSKLEVICLGGQRIDSAALAALAHAQHQQLPALKTLNFLSCSKNLDWKLLWKDLWPNLEALEISNCYLSQLEDFAAVAEGAEKMPKLRLLRILDLLIVDHITGQRVSRKGISALINANWPSLETINLWPRTQWTEDYRHHEGKAEEVGWRINIISNHLYLERIR